MLLTTFLLSFASAERVGSFIVVGDWGYDNKIHCNPSSGCGMSPQCQQNIGNLMKDWVAKNSDVKFVLNLGDSFYPAGVADKYDARWSTTWKNVYGATITNLRWYSIYGNHDYEGRDYCACADPAKNPSACAQRLTSGMDGWYMPDLYYHDTTYLSELGIEIVAMDTNSVAESACQYLPSGCSRGSCWANLNARYSASMDLFSQRLKSTTADNLLVINHYPSYYFGGSRSSFINAMKQGASNDAQIYFLGGHVHFVQENYGVDISPAKAWLPRQKNLNGGGGGWGCDGSAQGFTVGIINKDSNGKTTITMETQLVNHASCCYHHMSLSKQNDGEAEHWEDENDNAVYRTDEWWEGQLKQNGMWNQTCGGMECQSRRELLDRFRSNERLEGLSAEATSAKKLLEDELDRESGANFEFSQLFKDNIESIRKEKEASRIKVE